MPICLTPIDSNGKQIVLDKAILFFGRHPECDVVLTRSRKISRKHCCIAQVNNRLVVRDLGSMNGVRINRERVEREGRLRVGDELAIGDLCYHVEDVAAPPRRGVLNSMAAAHAASGAEHAGSPVVQGIDPAQISCDVPVIVSEEGRDFAVEDSAPDRDEDDYVQRVDPDEYLSLNDSEIM